MDILGGGTQYCGAGRLDETVDWVQNDVCDAYVHQLCDSPSGNKSYSGTFVCRACCYTNDTSEHSEVNVSEICEKHLHSLKLTDAQRQSIEQSTRDQRNSLLWHYERKKRITASTFGQICRARSVKSKYNLACSIIEDKSLDQLPAIKYGIQNEPLAIEKYTKKTECKYQKAGLFIHKQYPFLTGFPDGLIDDHGIIEIKCPYTLRDRKIKPYALEYLDSEGKLKVTHPYYYQIQGLLNITERNWWWNR